MVVENSVRLGELEMDRARAPEQAELQRASMLALTEPISLNASNLATISTCAE